MQVVPKKHFFAILSYSQLVPKSKKVPEHHARLGLPWGCSSTLKMKFCYESWGPPTISLLRKKNILLSKISTFT